MVATTDATRSAAAPTSWNARQGVRWAAFVLATGWALWVLAVFARGARRALEGEGLPAGPVEEEVLWFGVALVLALGLSMLPGAWPARLVVVGAGAVVVGVIGLVLAVGPVAAPVLGTAAICTFAFGIGQTCLRVVRAEQFADATLRVAVCEALGLGLLSHLMLGLGLLNLFHAPLLQTVVLSGAAVTIWANRRVALRAVDSILALRPSPGPVACVAAVAIGATTLLVLFLALSPEIYPDPVASYMPWAKAYYTGHGVIELAELRSYFHLAFQMLFIPGFALGGDGVAKLLPVVFGVLATVFLYSAVRRDWGVSTAFVAVTLFLTTPIVVWDLGGAQNDIAVVAYIIGALAVLRRQPAEGDVRGAVLAGALIGLAVAMKLQAVVFAVGVAAAYLVSGRFRFRPALAGAGVALLLASPWFVLRLVQTGNPVFPLYNAVFRSDMAPPINETYDLAGLGMGTSPLDLVRLPYDLTMHIEAFGGAWAFGAQGAIVLLAVVAPLVARWNRALAAWGAFALVSVVGWFLVVQHGRYLMPALPALAALASLTLVQFGRPLRGRLSEFAAAALLAAFTLVTVPLTFASIWRVPERIPVDVVFGTESRDAFLARTVRGYAAARALAVVATGDPERDRVMVFTLGQYPTMYSDHWAHEFWDHEAQAILNREAEPAVRARALREAGYRWLAFDTTNATIGRSYIRGGEVDPAYLGAAARPVFARSGIVVYELNVGAPAASETDVPLCGGGFDAASDGCWETSGAVTIGGEPSDPAVELTAPAWVAQTIPVCGGVLYRVRASATPTTPDPRWRMDLVWYSGSAVVQRETVVGAVIAEDPEPGLLATAPPGATSLRLQLGAHAGSFALDDVRVSTVGGVCP